MISGPLIEIYPERSPRDLGVSALANLESGWQKVAVLLAEIGKGGIAGLEVIEIALLDDIAMAEVHGEFLNDSTTTDVITFEHGELLIGVEVAERQAMEYEHDFLREIALYGIHGMLHLSGFDDRNPQDAECMRQRQEALLESHFSRVR